MFPHPFLGSEEPPENTSSERRWHFLCPGISDWQDAKELLSYFKVMRRKPLSLGPGSQPSIPNRPRRGQSFNSGWFVGNNVLQLR